tara:strand:+ start:2628 stop:2900 length:273 start_codon:yes stop_codon:yes gene_type:complete
LAQKSLGDFRKPLSPKGLRPWDYLVGYLPICPRGLLFCGMNPFRFSVQEWLTYAPYERLALLVHWYPQRSPLEGYDFSALLNKNDDLRHL